MLLVQPVGPYLQKFANLNVMAIQLFAKYQNAAALIEIQNNYAPKTAVREITGSSPITHANPHGEGAGAWIRPLGAAPIELDTGEKVVLDVTEPLRRQYSQPGAELIIRIDIESTPSQDCVGALYRLAFGADGAINNFENAGG
jgi:hypothetical protein